jgi:hypothetical protein
MGFHPLGIGIKSYVPLFLSVFMDNLKNPLSLITIDSFIVLSLLVLENKEMHI